MKAFVAVLALACLSICTGYTCNQFKNSKMGNWFINVGAEDDMGRWGGSLCEFRGEDAVRVHGVLLRAFEGRTLDV